MSETTHDHGNPERRVFEGKGQELDDQFRAWWNEARKSEDPPSPTEFLENFGMDDEGTIKACWVTFFKSFYGGEQGDTDYFAHYLKDSLDGTWHRHGRHIQRNFEERRGDDPVKAVLARGPRHNSTSEQDIKVFIDLLHPRLSDFHLNKCIENNYSPDLVDFLFKRRHQFKDVRAESSTRELEAHHRQVVDESLMMIIEANLHKIASSLALEFRGEWTEEALRRCVRMMLKDRIPKRWELRIPSALKTVPALTSPDPVTPPGNEVGLSGMNDLTIHFSDHRPSSLMIMESIPRMTQLKKLEVNLGSHLKMAAPFLACSIRKSTKLETITISGHSDPPTDCGLLDVLEALKANVSITSFEHSGGTEDENKLCEKKALEVLQHHNATLRCVRLGSPGPIKKKISYFESLNAHGRAVVRDPELKLSDFLPILNQVNDHLRNRRNGMRREGLAPWVVSVLFGLLLEQPGFWSVTSSTLVAAIEGRTLKRKHANEGNDATTLKARKV